MCGWYETKAFVVLVTLPSVNVTQCNRNRTTFPPGHRRLKVTRSSSPARGVSPAASREERLALFGPEEVQGFGLALLPLVDPPQAQDVEQDGEQHHQDAERQQVMVVDEGGAQPAGVVLAQRFLLQVPAETRTPTLAQPDPQEAPGACDAPPT